MEKDYNLSDSASESMSTHGSDMQTMARSPNSTNAFSKEMNNLRVQAQKPPPSMMPFKVYPSLAPHASNIPAPKTEPAIPQQPVVCLPLSGVSVNAFSAPQTEKEPSSASTSSSVALWVALCVVIVILLFVMGWYFHQTVLARNAINKIQPVKPPKPNPAPTPTPLPTPTPIPAPIPTPSIKQHTFQIYLYTNASAIATDHRHDSLWSMLKKTFANEPRIQFKEIECDSQDGSVRCNSVYVDGMQGVPIPHQRIQVSLIAISVDGKPDQTYLGQNGESFQEVQYMIQTMLNEF